MKVIKRDGSIVEYDSLKIVAALEKANKEVQPDEIILKKDIRRIIHYIEKLDRKRILVEDIQDIIEMKLMEFSKYALAKKYIVYRYNRALVRKQNTTDESILSLIKNKGENSTFENPNKNARLISTQRDLIAGEVSKDLTKRILLPENIVSAHEDGILYFHASDYFLQPIFNSSYIDIGNMLENGTVMNYKKIKSPKSFGVACNIMTQIIALTSSSQYGGQTISIKPFGKYLNMSKKKIEDELKNTSLKKEEIEHILEDRLKKEVVAGVQTIEYQINTLMTANGLSPDLTLLLEFDEKDPYINETACIIEEILKRRIHGMENEFGEVVTPEFPKLVYVLSDINVTGKYRYITDLALKCARIRKYPRFLSMKKIKENYKGKFHLLGDDQFLFANTKKGCFNEGVVTLNLPQIALISNKDDTEFFNILKERVNLCIDTLLRRHYALLGTSSSASPLHYEYGAIARLNHDTKIDILLTNSSTLSLGYIGLKETVYYMKNTSIYDKVGKNFTLKILKNIRSMLDKACNLYNVNFVLYATNSNYVTNRFYEIDTKYHLGKIKEYTNLFGFDQSYNYLDRLKIEQEYQNLTNGGSISKVLLKEIENDKQFIDNIYNTILYVEIEN